MSPYFLSCLAIKSEPSWNGVQPLLLVCPVEGEGVASEVNDVLAEVKLLVDVPHRCVFGVHAFEGLGVVLVKVGHKD